MPGSVKGTIARNTVFNAAGRFFEAAVGIVLTPYILTRIHYGDWGLWSLVAAFTGYAALLDFGISSGFSKYIAEHAARDDRHAAAAVVTSGFYFYLAFGVLVMVVGWPSVDFVVDWVVPWLRPDAAVDKADTAAIEDLRFLLRGALALFAVNNMLSPFIAAPVGVQRMGLSNMAGAVTALGKLIATAAFLECGFAVRGLLYANAVVLLLSGALSVALAFWLLPGLRLRPADVRRDVFEQLFSFGWRAQVAKLSNLINFQTDRVVIAWFSGLGMAGIYRIGEELSMKVRQLPALLVTAFVPAASDLDARARRDKLSEFYLRGTKYMAAVAMPLTVFGVVIAAPLLRLWIGSLAEPAFMITAAWVMRILLIGYFANLIAGSGMSIALGMGRADFAMKAGLISMSANIALTIALVFVFGIYGVALGTALSMVLSTLWFFVKMRDVIDVPLRRIVAQALFWPGLAALPGGVACGALAYFGRNLDGRLPNLFLCGAAAAVFGISYVAVLRFAPFLDRFDRGFLLDTLRLRRVPGAAWLAGE